MNATRALHMAVDWQVRLESGSLSEQDRHAFERWRRADPENELAWHRVSNLLHDAFDQVRANGLRMPAETEAVRKTLLHTKRRQMLRGALAFTGVGIATWMFDRQAPIEQLAADLRTGTGERRTFTLEDGSTLQLNARSAADLAYTADQRRVQLRQGALVATAASDTRPFTVDTASFTAQSRHGQFLVSQQNCQPCVVALKGSVQIQTKDGQRSLLAEGTGVRIDAQGMTAIDGMASSLAAWSYGMLAIENGTMRDVVMALKPYYAGVIRMSPEAAALPVFGSFPLVDATDVLQTLAHTLPIRMRHYGSWLIDLRHA